MELLERLGHEVEFPEEQTCCGQMHYNTGYGREAIPLVRRFVEVFEDYDAVVAPSGSCVGMIRLHFREALADDPAWLPRAESLAARTHELLSFLVDVRGWRPSGVALAASATPSGRQPRTSTRKLSSSCVRAASASARGSHAGSSASASR